MAISVGGNVLGAEDFNPRGVTVHPPDLVTRNIILWLDSANDYSYKNTSNYYDCGYGCQYYSTNPGGGCVNCNQIWRDMSGYGNDVELVNGAAVSYTTANGAMEFASASSDRCVNKGTLYPPKGAFSYFIWINYKKITGTGGYALTGTQDGGNYSYLGIQDGGQGYFYAGLGNNCGTYNYQFSTDVWYYNGFTLDSSGNVKLYVNGDLVDTKNGVGVGGTATNLFFVGCVNNNHFMSAYIPIVQMYERAITQDEITQNFNNGRVRFKI